METHSSGEEHNQQRTMHLAPIQRLAHLDENILQTSRGESVGKGNRNGRTDKQRDWELPHLNLQSFQDPPLHLGNWTPKRSEPYLQ